MFRRPASFAALLALAAFAAGVQAANVDILVNDAAGAALPGAVVMLEADGPHAPVKPMAGVQVNQHDLQFDPQLTIVTVGTSVLFPNTDTVRHHVYSFSPAKTFQLKLYAGVPHAPIVFDKPGVAVLGCNIHDQMVAWVVVADTPYFARSGQAGHARIDGVPPGSYQLKVWHPSLSEATPPQASPMTIGPADVEQRIKLNRPGAGK